MNIFQRKKIEKKIGKKESAKKSHFGAKIQMNYF